LGQLSRIRLNLARIYLHLHLETVLGRRLNTLRSTSALHLLREFVILATGGFLGAAASQLRHSLLKGVQVSFLSRLVLLLFTPGFVRLLCHVLEVGYLVCHLLVLDRELHAGFGD